MRMNPFWKIRITGREHVDRNATYVIVANHASLADVVLMYSLKTQFKWVAKKSLFTIPIMGWSLWIVRHISLNRGDYASIKATYKKAAEWLRKGISVVFFPEGTRSTTEDMNPFQNGAFKLAIRERKPILPVVLSGSRDAIPRGSWIFKTDINCTVEILPPIPTHTLQAGDFLRLKELTLKQFAARGKKVGVSCSEENADGL